LHVNAPVQRYAVNSAARSKRKAHKKSRAVALLFKFLLTACENAAALLRGVFCGCIACFGYGFFFL
jgi:hypothetical protein